jgi:hypothetical protein
MLFSLVLLSATATTPPHLAQAWTAMSTGDGLKGETGKESYIYDECKAGPTDTCMKGHKWDYGPSCIKYEVDRGNASPYSGTYYVKCDAVNCCQAESHHARPDVKKWDIGQAGKLMGDKIVYLGKKTTTGLDNATKITADAWNETFNIPFTQDKAQCVALERLVPPLTFVL